MSVPRHKRIIVLAAFSILVLFVLFQLASRRDVMGYSPPTAFSQKTKLIVGTQTDPKKGAGIQPEADKKDENINNKTYNASANNKDEYLKTSKETKTTENDENAAVKKGKPVQTKGLSTKNEVDDTHGKGEDYDPKKVLAEIRLLEPMIVFSKTFCGFSQRIKKLLAENYEITPAPMYVELDKYAHGPALQTYIGEISGRKLVPNVLIGNSDDSRGGADDFVKWHAEGTLENKLNEWGNKLITVKRITPPPNV